MELTEVKFWDDCWVNAEIAPSGACNILEVKNEIANAKNS